MTERDLLAAILARYGALPGARLWRSNCGVALAPNRRAVRFGVPGQGDISGIIGPNGRRLEIECKTKTGHQSERQRAFQRMIEEHGGLYILAREPIIPELEYLL